MYYFSTQSPCFATHLVHMSTSLRMPSRKKLFGVAFDQLCTPSITSSSSANLWPCKCSFIGPNKWQSNNCLHTEPSFFCRFQKVSHPPTQKMNKASLLFHGASWQWSGHIVWAIVQAHTARSSRRLYGMLLRSHFVPRNKIFHYACFSMYFRIKFLLFNDFPSYISVICKW